MLKDKQYGKDQRAWDYGYIEYYHKAMANYTDPEERSDVFYRIKYHEARRDYFTQSMRQINHLVQIDEQPNLELKEPRWEIYKISLSFEKSKALYI